MCGTRLEANGVHDEAPHVFGRPPPLAPTAAIAVAAALVAGLLVSGRWELGVALAALFALGAAACIVLARRAGPGGTARGLRHARDRALFAAGSVRSWSAAARAILPLRRELRRLDVERRDRTLALGEAALREDADEMALLRAEVQGFDERAAELQRRVDAIADSTRRRVEHERLTVQPTVIARPEGAAESGEPDEPDARHDPPSAGDGAPKT